jgi:hypothetical protein
LKTYDETGERRAYIYQHKSQDNAVLLRPWSKDLEWQFQRDYIPEDTPDVEVDPCGQAIGYYLKLQELAKLDSRVGKLLAGEIKLAPSQGLAPIRPLPNIWKQSVAQSFSVILIQLPSDCEQLSTINMEGLSQ